MNMLHISYTYMIFFLFLTYLNEAGEFNSDETKAFFPPHKSNTATVGGIVYSPVASIKYDFVWTMC